MLFNSYSFLIGFLPIAFTVFSVFGTSRKRRITIIALSGYFCYSIWQADSFVSVVSSFRIHDWISLENFIWQWRFTLILFFSSTVDYWAAKIIFSLSDERATTKKILVILSVGINLSFLFFFKYFSFVSQTVSDFCQFFIHGAGWSATKL